MSTPFEDAVKAGSWDAAADQLNGLAMFDMLPALAKLGAGRATAVKTIVDILNGRGWTGSADRIKWAGDVVADRRPPAVTPASVLSDQVDDARSFLAAPAVSLSAGPAAAHAEVMAAVRSGKITGGGAAQLLEFDRNGFVQGKQETAVISPLVFIMLQGLIQGGTSIEVMNIARPDDKPGSPHGRGAVGEQRTSFACDISKVDGDKIVLRPDGANVEPTIRAVATLLSHLPPGFYKVGFPRPSTALGGPVFPEFDVFLPALSMSDVDKPPPGKLGKDSIPVIKNPDAKSAVQAALDGNPKARISMMFPDGFNHAHLEIIASP
jgi:hypothetical protein